MADDNMVSSPIAGAEIVEKDGSTKPATDNFSQDLQVPNQTGFDPEAFEATKALVMRKTTQADEIKGKIREINESLKNILTNDNALSESEEKLKETRVAVQKRRKELNTSPEAQSIRAKLTEFKEELRDIEDSLSTQLLNLYQMTGVQEFETPSGEVREFVVKARVKAKKK